jgi:hypothetical protein
LAKKQKPVAGSLIKQAPTPTRQPTFKTPSSYKAPNISRRPIRQPGR